MTTAAGTRVLVLGLTAPYTLTYVVGLAADLSQSDATTATETVCWAV